MEKISKRHDDGFHQNHHHHALKTITRERCERDLIPQMQTRILLSCIHFFKAFEKRERAFVCAFFLSLVHRASKMSVVFCPSFLLFFSLFFRLKWDDDSELGFPTQPTLRERYKLFKNVPSSPERPFSSPVRLFWTWRWFVTSSRIPFLILYYVTCDDVVVCDNGEVCVPLFCLSLRLKKNSPLHS